MTTAMTIPATNLGRRTDALAGHVYTVPVVRFTYEPAARMPFGHPMATPLHRWSSWC